MESLAALFPRNYKVGALGPDRLYEKLESRVRAVVQSRESLNPDY